MSSPPTPGSAWDAPSLSDRAEDHRGAAGWVQAQWEHPGARVIPVLAAGRVAWTAGAPGYRAPAGALDGRQFLLGLVDGVPVFAEVATELDESVGLRQVMDGLDPTDLQVVFTAAALAAWHEQARFCGGCGTATQPERGGFARRCPGCGCELYPRVDPAVIVAVTDPDDRLLLGRHVGWEGNRRSVFAGFSEAGESLEQAVHRELFEEVGVRLFDLRYVASQPWPFPRSLMLAFTARTEDTEIVLDPAEIAEARWFSRAELEAALSSGALGLPMRTSVAYRLITAWREGRLR
ncbi:MAG: NAD(+) diphosphatase [Propionicimonas sp.]|nr:NAD(+) diphosphatase [Propionicimonas sp.]